MKLCSQRDSFTRPGVIWWKKWLCQDERQLSTATLSILLPFLPAASFKMAPQQEGKSSTHMQLLFPDFIFLVVFLFFFKTGSWQLQSQEEHHDYPVCLQQAVRTEVVFILTTSLQREQQRCCPQAHSLCTQQMNMFGGYFLLKQIGGGQPSKSERCWFPQRLHYRVSAQSSLHHMPHGHHSVHYHFTPSLEERPVWANPSSWLLVSRWNLSQSIPSWQYAKTSPAF